MVFVEGVDFISVPTQNIEQAKKFYGELAADTVDTRVCYLAFFTDPDGNRLILQRRYAPREG